MKRFRFRFDKAEIFKLLKLSKEERIKQFERYLKDQGLTKDEYYVIEAKGPFIDLADPRYVFIVAMCQEIEDRVAEIISPEGEILRTGKIEGDGVVWEN